MELRKAIEVCKRDYAISGKCGDALAAVLAVAEEAEALGEHLGEWKQHHWYVGLAGNRRFKGPYRFYETAKEVADLLQFDWQGLYVMRDE